MSSVPWDSASLRQEPAVSFFSIWQHPIQVLMQGSKQVWGVSMGNLWGHAQGVGRAPAAGTRDSEAGGLPSGLGCRWDKRRVKDINRLYTTLPGAPSLNFLTLLGQTPLKGQTAELTGERISFFLVPQPNA